MRVPDAEFKKRTAGKTAWLVSANSDEDGLKMSEPMIGTLQLSAAYMGMSWGGTLISSGNRPGDVLNDVEGWSRAERFFV